MEILSTGEKIKRARVYKGVTLKELCGDKISISKMSCIENEKIEADDEILLYVANKLKIDYNYLKEGVKEQIIQNIKKIENNSISEEEIETFIRINLNHSKENKYNDLAFKLINMLFKKVVESGVTEQLQEIITQYFDMYESNNSLDNILIYYNDMAEFYSLNKEYNESINYYNKILTILEKHMPKEKEQYINTLFNKGQSYLKLNDVESAFLIMEKVKKNIKKVKDDELQGKIVHSYANLSILLGKEGFEENLKLAFQCLQNKKEIVAKCYAETAKVYFVVGKPEEAAKYIIDGINLFKQIGGMKYVRFLISCIEVLFEYEQYNFAMEMIEEALNLAIGTNDIRLIERAYYFKGMILQKSGDSIGAEMYMNLSTDSLLKFATKKEKHKRYNEMGQLYYNLNELKESIKYFTLAMSIEKEL